MGTAWSQDSWSRARAQSKPGIAGALRHTLLDFIILLPHTYQTPHLATLTLSYWLQRWNFKIELSKAWPKPSFPTSWIEIHFAVALEPQTLGQLQRKELCELPVLEAGSSRGPHLLSVCWRHHPALSRRANGRILKREPRKELTCLTMIHSRKNQSIPEKSHSFSTKTLTSLKDITLWCYCVRELKPRLESWWERTISKLAPHDTRVTIKIKQKRPCYALLVSGPSFPLDQPHAGVINYIWREAGGCLISPCSAGEQTEV